MHIDGIDFQVQTFAKRLSISSIWRATELEGDGANCGKAHSKNSSIVGRLKSDSVDRTEAVL
jgi:hypothetical protein